MGNPLHWEPPARSAAASNARAKADPLAPSRSTIRRQRTLRRPHRNNNGSRSASSNRPAGYVSSRSSMPQWVESLTRETLGDSAPSSTATARGTATTTGEPGASRYTSSQDNESRLDWPASSSYSSSQTRRDIGDQIARTTALRYSSPGRRRIRIPRESSLRFEMLQPPSWPHSTERSRRSELNSDATANARLENRLGDIVSFSPRFAPAYPPRSNERAMVSSDSYDPNMPLLRRVGHRSVADTSDVDATRPRHIIDGLGDRDRSFSPGGDSQHDDDDSHYHDDDDDDDDDDEPNMWESLFTTITPDQHLPSLDSSFTSATASASTAPSRNSANSSQSTLPSSVGANNNPSRRPGVFPPLESFTDHNNHCDFFSSSEDSETEPDSDNEHIPTWRLMQYDSHNDSMPMSSVSVSALEAIRRSEQQQQLRRRYQDITQTIRAVIAETPANRNADRNTATNINTNTNTTSSFTSSSTTPTSTSTPTSINVSFGQSSSLGDLQQVQTIIDQLTRRQDIGDEWWAAVGLSRNLGRGVTDVPARNGSGNGGSGDAESR
ncbi:hypothetical protein EMPG_14544 [Blastomyces silverae]|uniref:Uncharacterized protein n=1 Tax=Blastomyces silverae TaxID=2060906 RepID=A0A0H1BF00_9EURO|nr:hypothetical protein EMPG_14544 [Blastomyces silverae]